MSDIVRHEIVVDSLMEQVKYELVRRRSSGDVSAPLQQTDAGHRHIVDTRSASIPDREQTVLWKLMKNMQHKLQKFSFYDFLYFRIALIIKKFVPKFKKP